MLNQGRNLKILFVSAEVSPYAKTGGLADVAGSLPQTLAAKGNDIRIAMPAYKTIKYDMSYLTDFPVQLGSRKETCIIRELDTAKLIQGSINKVPVYFVDNYHYFDRESVYCCYDDGDRFAFLCSAVLEMLPRINFQPDIIHCNDWHTGPICMLLKERYNQDCFYSGIKCIFTIHNLEYQGLFPKGLFDLFNLGDDIFIPDKVEFYGSFNFMKAGLVYADKINTVSSRYAEEIQTHQYGEKLDGLLRKRSEDLWGIVNGISYDDFNPETDPSIYKNYSAAAFGHKKENKYALQKEMGLKIGDMPLMGLISRLSGQKGLNLIIDEIDEIFKHDAQFVLLGTGDPYYENTFKSIKDRYPDKMGVYIGFNAALAQRIYAGSDIFLMPSRFEPCGLGQVISLRYGTIPVVRETGGLAETIIDYNENNACGNGFSFKEFSSKDMLKALERALDVYKNRPEDWEMLVERALKQDFSWSRSAEKYMELYHSALR